MDKPNASFDITELIPIGRLKAVSRKHLSSVTGLSDHAIGHEIEKSHSPIMNLSYGYFISDEHDDIDRSKASAYIAQERAAFLQQPIDHMSGSISREKRTVDYSKVTID